MSHCHRECFLLKLTHSSSQELSKSFLCMDLYVGEVFCTCSTAFRMDIIRINLSSVMVIVYKSLYAIYYNILCVTHIGSLILLTVFVSFENKFLEKWSNSTLR